MMCGKKEKNCDAVKGVFVWLLSGLNKKHMVAQRTHRPCAHTCLTLQVLLCAPAVSYLGRLKSDVTGSDPALCPEAPN